MERDFAYDELTGNPKYTDITGLISFIQYPYHVEVSLFLENIPKDQLLRFHIYEGTTCSEKSEDEFVDAKIHYAPDNSDYPNHTWDLPSIYSYDDKVRMTFNTDKFFVRDILGKTIILYKNLDNFRNQLASDAESKIACGEITH